MYQVYGPRLRHFRLLHRTDPSCSPLPRFLLPRRPDLVRHPEQRFWLPLCSTPGRRPESTSSSAVFLPRRELSTRPQRPVRPVPQQWFGCSSVSSVLASKPVATPCVSYFGTSYKVFLVSSYTLAFQTQTNKGPAVGSRTPHWLATSRPAGRT